jgi:SPP1 gp7 family putative phage head morphogenesis protein
MGVFNPRKLQAKLKKQRNMSFSLGVDPPISLEIKYYKEILKWVVKPIIKEVEKEIIPELKKNEIMYKNSDLKSEIAYKLNGILAQYATIIKTKSIVDRMVASTDRFNRNKFVSQIGKAIGVPLSGVLKDGKTRQALDVATEKNVALIKTIPEEYFGRIEAAIMQGIDRGDDFFSIRLNIKEIGQVTDRRARLIARDQTSKLNASLNKARQEDTGITGYFWRTSQDEAVRPTHEANDGQRFDWDSPPPETGHPGEDVQCRCTADPDLSTLNLTK